MCTADVKELLALAATLATAAGVELLARQAAFSIDGPAVETKSSASDPVTAADRASEKLIADGLAAARPDDGLVGEEGASKASVSGITW
ncbi:MAG: monophosphatase, partial [Actinomycetota bacterium]|nr:monophosphatase [Actinomycetota bacterium]